MLKKEMLIAALVLCFIFSLEVSAQLYGWGYNQRGQLGDGTNVNRPTPLSMGRPDITAVSANYTHTIALLADGTLLAWGQNDLGALGDGTGTIRFSPVPVQNLSRVTAIATGAGHSMALRDDGTVWAWGRNWEGELGIGSADTGSHPIPVQVPGLTDVISISSHYLHTLALKADGTVWAWGNNFSGQTGQPALSAGVPSPVRVNGLSNVIQIVAGHQHSVALKSDGSVWVWGFNGNGEFGNNTSSSIGCQCQTVPVQASITGITQITAGFNNTAALKPNGDVFVWGRSSAGQLGNNSITGGNALLPVQTPISNVIELKMRGDHLLARLRDGAVKAWGRNFEGELGNGTTNTTGCLCNPSIVSSQVGAGNASISAGNYHSFSLKPSIPINPGTNIFLAGENVRLKFANIVSPGAVSYRAIDASTDPLVTGVTPPANYVIQDNQPAYNIETTAAGSGDINVCLNVTAEYDPTAFAFLRLLNREGSMFADHTVSSNYIKRQLCAKTTDLSAFVVAHAPTRMVFSISGKVSFADGRAASRATVSLIDSFGNLRERALTNPFGNYSFANVSANETYTIGVSAKGTRFTSQTILVDEAITDLNFIGM
jgi:alpha-tubulin suppressor-like RCC1 family protein